MAINKNFVVKNGFEVSTDLILANADTRKVGIASTNPKYTLDVRGGIGATDLYLVGISTVLNELNVGADGSVLTALGVGGSIGIGTALPEYLVDIRSPVSTGQTALYVQGDVKITGDLGVDDLTFDQADINSLNVSGIATIATLGVSGLTTTQYLEVTGISTFVGLATFNGGLQVVSGITTLDGYVDINNSVDILQNLKVSGVSTFVGFATFNDYLNVQNGLNVSGITTLGVATATNFTLQQLNISGISTLGVVTATDVINQNLFVSGISTLGTLQISSGVVTATSGIITYYGDGSGLINTPPGFAAGNSGEVQYNSGGNFTGSPNFTFDGNTVSIGSTISSIGLNVIGIVTVTNSSGGVIIGVGTTALLVNGNARVTGILTVGNSSITLDGLNDIINVGTGVTINGSTGTLTATSFVGDGSGLTGAGSTVADDITTNATFYPLFTQTTSGIVTSTKVSTSKLSFNPSTGTLNATKFSGDGSALTGAGSSVSDDTTTNQSFYPLFTQTTTGIVTASRVSTSKLSFNPSTGTLSATKFVGDGSGLTGAGSTVADDTATNSTFYPVFTQTTSGTITASKVSTTKLSFNPSTGILTVVDLNSTSDENLKTNIQTVNNALQSVNNLRGVSFEWKETGKPSYGVIAQELQKVLPELVGDGETKTVNYNGIIGILIEAIKELSEEVQNLKEQLNNK